MVYGPYVIRGKKKLLMFRITEPLIACIRLFPVASRTKRRATITKWTSDDFCRSWIASFYRWCLLGYQVMVLFDTLQCHFWTHEGKVLSKMSEGIIIFCAQLWLMVSASRRRPSGNRIPRFLLSGRFIGVLFLLGEATSPIFPPPRSKVSHFASNVQHALSDRLIIKSNYPVPAAPNLIKLTNPTYKQKSINQLHSSC